MFYFIMFFILAKEFKYLPGSYSFDPGLVTFYYNFFGVIYEFFFAI